LGIEVHAVDAGDEGERDEDRGDDGEHPHHLVGAVGDARQVEVGEPVGDVAVGLDDVEDLHRMVVAVAQEQAGLGADQRGLAAGERVQHLALRPGGAAELEEILLELVEAAQDGRGG
jgi:hypothetical protein